MPTFWFGNGSNRALAEGQAESPMKSKTSILENILVLALIGLLVGGVAGLGIGVLTGRTPSSTSTTQ
jgi:hypothetical protein